MREKDAARLLVYHALKTIHYGDCEKVVRVNPLSTPYGKADIEAMVGVSVGAMLSVGVGVAGVVGVAVAVAGPRNNFV